MSRDASGWHTWREVTLGTEQMELTDEFTALHCLGRHCLHVDRESPSLRPQRLRRGCEICGQITGHLPGEVSYLVLFTLSHPGRALLCLPGDREGSAPAGGLRGSQKVLASKGTGHLLGADQRSEGAALPPSFPWKLCP